MNPEPGFDLKTYLKNLAEQVDEALLSYLPPADQLPSSLHQAMHYSIFAGGKRIRPVLVLAACAAAGGDPARALPAACALEMVHTYSLVHDDLPAMDDDNFRRGRPTNHRVYGEATAILAGDALLTEAFILLSGSAAESGIAPAALLTLVHKLALAAGSNGMVGGQVVDMESEQKEIDLATLNYIHTRKTGALILAAVEAGALVAGASEKLQAGLRRYGEAIGLAFQVADDILDIVGDQAELGKDVGSDQQRGKATYPALVGLGVARERAGELRDLALQALAPFGPEAEPLRQLARYVVARTS